MVAVGAAHALGDAREAADVARRGVLDAEARVRVRLEPLVLAEDSFHHLYTKLLGRSFGCVPGIVGGEEPGDQLGLALAQPVLLEGGTEIEAAFEGSVVHLVEEPEDVEVREFAELVEGVMS